MGNQLFKCWLLWQNVFNDPDTFFYNQCCGMFSTIPLLLNITFEFCAKITNHPPPCPQANKWGTYAISFMYTFQGNGAAAWCCYKPYSEGIMYIDKTEKLQKRYIKEGDYKLLAQRASLILKAPVTLCHVYWRMLMVYVFSVSILGKNSGFFCMMSGQWQLLLVVIYSTFQWISIGYTTSMVGWAT